ncbi:zinc finger, CCHC-type containing protein [Tanacetum coccineum]
MTKDSGDSSKKEVSTTSTPQFQCPMLKPSNYSLWAIRMQIILEANGLWETIEPLKTTQPDNKKDKTAIAFLYQALPEEQLLQITKHKTAKPLWCKKIGHIAPNCPQRIKANEQSNLVEEDLEPTLLMAILENSDEGKQVKEVEEQKVSLHEEDVGEHFKELDEKVSGKVRFGDGSYIEIKGKGSILIECDDEKQRIISHVYYIPSLKSNLLSLGQFTEIGCKVVMKDDELRLYDMDNKIFMKVTRQRNRLYKANLRIGTPVCLLANLKDDTWLWHARLGHLNFESLRSMAQRDLVQGIPAEDQKVSLHEEDVGYKETSKESLWYLDNGASNHMTGVREHFKELDEKVSGKVRFGDGSYIEIKGKENGIARQLTTPYSPQQNGVVKRRNRTIMSTTRCMMKATNMPQNFWAEAVRHAIYILNSVPTKALEDITPYEAIKRRKPNLENLRVFGCIAYAKVPSQRLTKLDDRSSRMVYLGNEQGSKAYRLFDPTTQKICVSRDVKFKENETWDWKEYMSEHINDEPEWTDFKIENLEVTSEHHDQGTQPSEEDNEFPNNDDDGYASPTTGSPSRSQTPHTPSTSSSQVNLQFTPNASTQSIYQSDSGSNSTTNSHSHFDHTPLRGFRTLNDLYENTEELLLAEDEPKNYKEASRDQKWIEAMIVEQAPHAWNIKLDNTLKSLDFKKCALEQAIYTKTSRDSTLLIGVYVDDLIITGTPRKEIDKFKAKMEEKFEMSDLGLLAYYLEKKVTQTRGDISIKQSAYANKILKEAGMMDCNKTLIPMDPGTRLTKNTRGTLVNSTEYRSLIRCLRYLLHTRPDLSYSVRLLSRFMQEPREQHMKAIKQVLRYVKEQRIMESPTSIMEETRYMDLATVVTESTLKKEKELPG